MTIPKRMRTPICRPLVPVHTGSTSSMTTHQAPLNALTAHRPGAPVDPVRTLGRGDGAQATKRLLVRAPTVPITVTPRSRAP